MSASTPPPGVDAPATPEEVWATLQRAADLIALSRAEAEKYREESRVETEKYREESRAETEKSKAEMAQLRESMKETDRRLKKAENLFTTQWGRLVESLVEGDLVPLLRRRGIEVERTLRRMEGERNGEHYEVDIVAANGSEVVVVEVKTTLRSRDVTRFLDKLSRFGDWFWEYRGRHVYGAVAYLRSDKSSDAPGGTSGPLRHSGDRRQRQHRERAGLQTPRLPLIVAPGGGVACCPGAPCTTHHVRQPHPAHRQQGMELRARAP